MSASYPSSRSWEPYGSSQQAHALGWRRPATRPTPPQPFATLPSATPPLSAHLPPAARWNQLHSARREPRAPLLGQPQSSDTPVGETEITPGAAASFRQHERDTRVLARYEQVKGDIRTVGKQVEKVAEQVREGGERGEKRDEGIERELARLQGLCNSVREDVREGKRERDDNWERGREERRRWERQVGNLVDKCVEKRVKEMGNNIQKKVKEVGNGIENRVMDAVERVVHARFDELTKVVREAVAEIVSASAVRNDKRGVPSRGRGMEQEVRDPTPARRDAVFPETGDSDDLYALQVANRRRPPAVQDFSDPAERGDLFNRMESQNEIEAEGIERDQEAGGTYPASSGTNFFEEDEEAFSRSLSAAITTSKDPDFKLVRSSSDSDSLKLGPFNRNSSRPRTTPKPRKAQTNENVRDKRNSRTTLAARSNVSKRPAAKRAPMTRSRAAVGSKRSRYPA